ncbi:MAG TPA: glycosyltransferase [Anaerolineales bacterium]|nr:glycosyltransferase [Anaerolineales bacterium]
MRVLQIIDSLRYGGAQKLMVTYAGQATVRGVDVTVVALSPKEAMPLAPQIEALGIPVVSFPADKLFTISRLSNLIKYVRDGKYSVIHSHLTYANILAGIVGLMTHTPVVSTLHSVALDVRHSHPLRDRMEWLALRNFARVIAIGPSVEEAYSKLLKRDMDLIPNAVNSGVVLSSVERDAVRAGIGVNPSNFLLISVGRLSPDKCFDDLLRSFAIIHSQRPETTLVIAGDGISRAELEEQTKTLGLTDSVFWLGMRDDIPALLAASDMFVSASKREGLPIAILEAMMAGLPLVVTDVGESSSLVGADAGILVQPLQPEVLASAVLEFINDPARLKAAGESARRRAQASYGAEAWFSCLLSLYNEVVH